MFTMNVLSITLIALILGCVLALVVGTRPAEASVPVAPIQAIAPGDIAGGSA